MTDRPGWHFRFSNAFFWASSIVSTSGYEKLILQKQCKLIEGKQGVKLLALLQHCTPSPNHWNTKLVQLHHTQVKPTSQQFTGLRVITPRSYRTGWKICCDEAQIMCSPQFATAWRTASTMCLALMPKMSSSSWGFPLRGTPLTASRVTTMPGSWPTADSTASPRPPGQTQSISSL